MCGFLRVYGRINGKKKTVRKRKQHKQPPLTVGRVKALALECISITEADGKTGVEPSLVGILKKYKRLAAAWDRGRFLRNLKHLAGTAVTVSEAAGVLKMEGGGKALRELLDSDVEAADVWNQARFATMVRVKLAVVAAAIDGKPAAAKQIENLLRQEIVKPSADLQHVNIKQLVEMTGKTRQTVHDWHTKYGLSRNSDKTYNLFVFFEWFEKFTLDKRTPNNIQEKDKYRKLKEDQLETILKKESHQLLERSQVMAGHVARQQALVSATERKGKELALLMLNQPMGKMEETLEVFFGDLRRAQCRVPDELMLPAAAAEKFAALLEEIAL